MLFYYLATFFNLAYADFKMVENFYFCHQNDQILDFDNLDNDLFNSINVFKKFEDEFNYVFVNGKFIIVYSNNNLLYTTSCEIINEIFILSSVSDCTNDLGVYFYENMNVSVLYLTKSCILRNTSTIVECTDEAENFFFLNTIL